MHYLNLDLHGESVERAENLVSHYIRKAYREGHAELRIITGRGNHPSRDRQRGKLYSKCEGWLQNQSLQPMLRSINKGDGYYDIKIQCKALVEQQFRNEDLDAFLKLPFCQNIEQQAESGVAIAQSLLGSAYAQGLGGYPVDEKLALQYFEKAAEQNEPGAQLEMAMRYFLGRSVRQNDKKALTYFKKVAETQSPLAAQLAATAKTNLGIIYCYGFGVPVDLKEGVNWLIQAAEVGHPEAMRRLAAYCYYGCEGCPKDPQKGFEWYLKAAQAGDADAQYNVGFIYESGREGVGIDQNMAFSWFLKSAQNSDSDGMIALASCYLKGQGTSIDLAKAAFWLTQAEEKGHDGVYVIWAEYYRTKGDMPQAMTRLEQGAATNDLFALCTLLIWKKEVDDTVLAKIMSHDVEEIIQKVPPSLQCHIVRSLLNEPQEGTASTKKEHQKAVKLLENLAKKHYPSAYTKLSALYALETPLGGPNIQRTFNYAEKGRKAGDIDCLYIVMTAYLEGKLAVKKNSEKAELYQKQLIERKHLRFLFQQALFDFEKRIQVPAEQNSIIESLREILILAQEGEKKRVTQPYFDLPFFALSPQEVSQTLGKALGKTGSLELVWLIEDKKPPFIRVEKLDQALLKLIESHVLGCLKAKEILTNFLRIENNPLFSSWKQLPTTTIQKVKEIVDEPIINELAQKVRELVFGKDPIANYFSQNNTNMYQEGASLPPVEILSEDSEMMPLREQTKPFPQRVEAGTIGCWFNDGPAQGFVLYAEDIQKALVILIRGKKGIALVHLTSALSTELVVDAFQKIGNLEEWRIAYDPHYHAGAKATTVKNEYGRIYKALDPIAQKKLNTKLCAAQQGHVAVDKQGNMKTEKLQSSSQFTPSFINSNEFGMINKSELEKAHHLYKLKNYKQALPFFKQALNTEEEKAGAIWCNMGHCHYNLQQFSEAISCYEQSLHYDSSQTSALQWKEKAEKREQTVSGLSKNMV